MQDSQRRFAESHSSGLRLPLHSNSAEASQPARSSCTDLAPGHAEAASDCLQAARQAEIPAATGPQPERCQILGLMDMDGEVRSTLRHALTSGAGHMGLSCPLAVARQSSNCTGFHVTAIPAVSPRGADRRNISGTRLRERYRVASGTNGRPSRERALRLPVHLIVLKIGIDGGANGGMEGAQVLQ
jgi:hypothetical protein